MVDIGRKRVHVLADNTSVGFHIGAVLFRYFKGKFLG